MTVDEGVFGASRIEAGISDARVVAIVGLERIGKAGVMPLVLIGKNFADSDGASVRSVQYEVGR